MSGKEIVVQSVDKVYLYDGSLPGFFSCVHACVYEKELPAAIWPVNSAELTLYPIREIVTDMEKAERVSRSIVQKISKAAFTLITHVFLSAMQEKELAMLRFLLLGYKEGARVLSMLGNPVVALLLKAETHLLHEQHLLLGFIRFSDFNGKLVANITPKNFVLPFLAGHFVSRFPSEDFLIFDKTHKAALLYSEGRQEIIALDELSLPDVSEEEAEYRALWKQFYNTIAIKERENSRCRMTHMPKRYWENMIEMQEFL